FSEHQIFAKYFPDQDRVPQEGFFVNNANSSILREKWQDLPWDEALTGLEDMDWAKKMVARGFKLAYCANAPVYHIHDESWRQIRIRYEREAVALQKIMPEIHIGMADFLRYFGAAVLSDWARALDEKVFFAHAIDIIRFRFCQYLGSWRGNRHHRRL